MEKLVQYKNSQLGLKASALTPRLYRIKFGRDMIVDLNTLKINFEKVQKAKGEDKADVDAEYHVELSVLDLTIFENVAFIMARQYNKAHGLDVPDNVDDWLDNMDQIFTIYEIFPDIMELWSLNQKTTSVPAKK
ncbi:MAG: hypothetical protein IKU47_08245 [Oscillospiraceae bacterium]|nr:hypothetical protein [Oscillospiraceae bacterium]